jgi:hypothetical protein
MSDSSPSASKTPAEPLAPFYEAIGKASVRWQFVEASLFVIVHAILKTEYRKSSAVFFHIQSPDSKLQLTDRLCQIHLDKDIISAEWDDFCKDLKEAIKFRNAIAHWEANFINDRSLIDLNEPAVALTRHHMDIWSEADTRGLTTSTLNEVAHEYRALANRLLHFVLRHFAVKELRATHLPQGLLQHLESIQNSPPEPPPPSPPSPLLSSRQARRRAAKQQRKR